MYPILICSVLSVALAVKKALEFRRAERMLTRKPDEVISEYGECNLSAAMGSEEVELVFENLMERMERGLSWLALIALVTPLLGLTGTVMGMIRAFIVISESSTVDPSLLAGGIWEALITTAAGLIVAIPTHVFHHYLDQKAERLGLRLKEVLIRLTKIG